MTRAEFEREVVDIDRRTEHMRKIVKAFWGIQTELHEHLKAAQRAIR